MTYEQVQSLKPEAFLRLCGVGSTTSAEMVSVLEKQQLQKPKPGRPSKLSLEDQVLLALQYWREYRTYFHIAMELEHQRIHCVPDREGLRGYIDSFRSV